MSENGNCTMPPVIPYLSVSDAAKALEWYQEAFGAHVGFRMDGPGGKLMHADFSIGSAVIMLAEPCSAGSFPSPTQLGGSPVMLHVYVDDPDAFCERAVAAGATQEMPVSDQFYGERSGSIRDPFGHGWSISKQIEQLSAEEIERRGKEWMAKMQEA